MLKRFFGSTSCRFVNQPHPGDLGLSDSLNFAIGGRRRAATRRTLVYRNQLILLLRGSPQSGDTGNLGLLARLISAFRFIRATLVLWDMVNGGGIAVRDGIAQYGTKWLALLLPAAKLGCVMT